MQGVAVSEDNGARVAGAVTQLAARPELAGDVTFAYVVLKRTFDIAFSVVLLALISPIAIVSGLLVLLTSPGPIIFAQKRVCQDGKLFDCYKFRTMVRDAEARLQDPELASRFEVAWKLKNDTRITPIGHWLRRLSIDELPQLINVLRGDMSVVGPRPVQPRELERQFGELKDIVIKAKPGLTSPWAVAGRSDLAYEERVWLDVEYVQNRCLLYDLSIVLKTIPAVLSHRGAV